VLPDSIEALILIAVSTFTFAAWSWMTTLLKQILLWAIQILWNTCIMYERNCCKVLSITTPRRGDALK
jgi:hypothetical protein